MPKLEQWEIKKYWQIFCGLKPVSKKLSKQKLETVFRNSHLDDSTLAEVWKLADIDEDAQLDFEEFCIAMRLIFDLVNGNIKTPPTNLPSWLIPGSKAQILKQRGDNSGSGSSNQVADSDDSDEDYQLSDDFDWYISPTDKKTYESVYDVACDKFGRVKFDSLKDLYKTLNNVPQTDISSAWNLVNPKQSRAVDKDQCMVYLHILNQRSHGRRVPRSVPASLRATFSKEIPDYNVDSHQGNIGVRSSSQNSNAFASGYLEKKHGSAQGRVNTQEDDFDEAHDENWEQVKLERELKNLTSRLDNIDKEKEQSKSEISMQKYELEQLLKYKQSILAAGQSQSGVDMQTIQDNIESVETQVAQLRDFLKSQKEQLSSLQSQVNAAKS
ncbi:hypothetical protein HII12_003811 [Brettanomyces bruxellensis]|uniref:Actin cytoskeleton-regulatory complex protein END3 n=1 Tax=Dekkera bruxellensis TaxID=5007 RepID=A0A8H6ESX6_DEKBR|nr:hypothetical protein HII12_003811 [Brettanomyces bruxellensis]